MKRWEVERYYYQQARSGAYGMLAGYARRMRTSPTPAERLLWQHLRGDRSGLHFRRQHIIEPYIVDFVCLTRLLIIEVDGAIHETPDQLLWDQERTVRLEKKGFAILRFLNEDVLRIPVTVVGQIMAVIHSRPHRR